MILAVLSGMVAVAEARELTAAFSSFTEVSSALQRSYAELEGQVSLLRAELERSRHARARLAGRFGQLLEALPAGVLLLDGSEVIRECNQIALELLGAPLCGQAWEQVRARALSGGSVFGGDVALPGGRHVSVSQRALDDGEGRIILVTDVTESHLVHELLGRNQRLSAMGEMAARLAHQLRTPLAAALLGASQLAGAGDERVRTLAQRTTARLHELERLIADMLGFAAGGGGPPVEVLVSAVLEDVVQSLAGRLRLGGQLTIRTRAPQLQIRASRAALAGAIGNLVVNALDVAGPVASVVVEASEPRPGIGCIRVSDNGPGVPASLRSRIFEPFFTTRPGGTGLGLAVVSSVVQAHGGQVRLEAEGPGATFTLELPALGTDRESQHE
ncbi:MAG: PAS domain-containing protein [Gammaproteobacteria bacterium]|nr:MAG: PAS domain-containing protein [Gammaproteobacteria bacterium]